ncbi:MAG: thermonuclease family protein [Clostridiales bacterium]|nr:thermonuclease family protein [Clostridiales bacterium]
MKFNKRIIKKLLKYIKLDSKLIQLVMIGVVLITTLILITNKEENKGKKSDNTKEVKKQYKEENPKEKEQNNAVSEEVKSNSKIKDLSVKRVVDGDTVVLEKNGYEYKVRLIGVDTPESVHLDKNKNTKEGKIASDFTKERLTGKKVDIEFDVKPQDKYGRYLVYLYLDGISYNEVLLEEGMARVMMISPNVKNKELYAQIEKRAKDKKIGIWK